MLKLHASLLRLCMVYLQLFFDISKLTDVQQFAQVYHMAVPFSSLTLLLMHYNMLRYNQCDKGKGEKKLGNDTENLILNYSCPSHLSVP